MRDALERGIVVINETVFGTASEATTVIFDKTGTLTEGEMIVESVSGVEGTLERAAAVERFASHSVADAVVTGDKLAAVDRVFSLAAGTRRRIRENIGWALCYNAVAIPLAVAGLINPFFAALAMAASSVLVVSNSRRPVL